VNVAPGSRPRVKVMVMVDSLTQGGAERQALEMARSLPAGRFDTVLCTLRDDLGGGYFLPPGLRRLVIGSKNPFTISRRLREFLAQEKPDIVHSFLEPSNFWNRLVAPGVGRPIVISSVRCRFMRPRFALVEKLLARRCHAVVVNSVGVQHELLRWQRVPAGKIRLIGNLVDFQRFRPLPDEVRQRVRSSLGLQGPTFLMPGRITIMKHQLGLVAALARLKRRHGLTPRTLGADKGYFVASFLDTLRRRGIKPHVACPATPIKKKAKALREWAKRKTRSQGYALSQRFRKQIEMDFRECFGASTPASPDTGPHRMHAQN